MSNKLRDLFMPYLKWLDKSIIDANPCNTCPTHRAYMEKALYGNVAERNYAEPPDCCPCVKKILWEGECRSKLQWYESQDERLHPELLEKPKQPIDPESLRPKGKWELHNSGNGTCSHCGRTSVAVWDFDNVLNYCPNCGAKMEVYNV